MTKKEKTSTVTLTVSLTVSHPKETDSRQLKEMTGNALAATFSYPADSGISVVSSQIQGECAVTTNAERIIGYEIVDKENYLYRGMIPGQLFRSPHNALLYMKRHRLPKTYSLLPVREGERIQPDYID